MNADSIAVPEPAGPPSGRFPGAPSLALTFVLAGIGYAFPIHLFAEDYPLNGPVSPEILNLNFLVAWMGLAHFVFAYSGQAKTLYRSGRSVQLLFAASMLVGAALLLLFRTRVSQRIFDSVVWVYFIPHFVKAELHFIKNSQPDLRPGAWVLYWFPALGFAFFTFALFGPLTMSFNPSVLIFIACICIIAAMAGNVLRHLTDPARAPCALLGFFFIGEGLVWGTYSKYMTPHFRQGLYVFHIAVASFYHYLRAYGFAMRKMPARQTARYLVIVAFVNVTIILCGAWAAWHPASSPAQYIFGVPYFTFWVGLHLISSDIFTGMKAGLRLAGAPSPGAIRIPASNH